MIDAQHHLSLRQTPKVLIIEDDEPTGEALVDALGRAGMRALWARTGAQGIAFKRDFVPDVVLVDLQLPDTDGMGLVGFLARHGACGVIILSGLTDEADRIVGLEIGADDYISKPPAVRELLARIRAVHRRVNLHGSVTPAEATVRSTVQLGQITVNFTSRSLQAGDGNRIMLTAAEFAALEALLDANGAAVSRDSLSRTALHRPWHSKDRSVDQLIFNLRQKLAAADDQPMIYSFRGAGYLLAVSPTEPTMVDTANDLDADSDHPQLQAAGKLP